MKLYVFLFFSLLINLKKLTAQTSYNKILWDKTCDCPLPYATIENKLNSTISNEDGKFSINTNTENVLIQMLGYETKNILLKDVELDTIYLTPKPFELEEIILNKDDFFSNMLNTIKNDYALEPQTEKFFYELFYEKITPLLR